MIIKIRNEEKNGWKYVDEVREVNITSNEDCNYLNITKSDGNNESFKLLTEAYLLNDRGDTLNRLHK